MAARYVMPTDQILDDQLTPVEGELRRNMARTAGASLRFFYSMSQLIPVSS